MKKILFLFLLVSNLAKGQGLSGGGAAPPFGIRQLTSTNGSVTLNPTNGSAAVVDLKVVGGGGLQWVPIITTNSANQLIPTNNAYNVIAYGAVPNNPSSDAQPAFMAALNAISNSPAGSGIINIPGGVYYLNEPIHFTNNIEFRGSGEGGGYPLGTGITGTTLVLNFVTNNLFDDWAMYSHFSHIAFYHTDTFAGSVRTVITNWAFICTTNSSSRLRCDIDHCTFWGGYIGVDIQVGCYCRIEENFFDDQLFLPLRMDNRAPAGFDQGSSWIRANGLFSSDYANAAGIEILGGGGDHIEDNWIVGTGVGGSTNGILVNWNYTGSSSELFIIHNNLASFLHDGILTKTNFSGAGEFFGIHIADNDFNPSGSAWNPLGTNYFPVRLTGSIGQPADIIGSWQGADGTAPLAVVAVSNCAYVTCDGWHGSGAGVIQPILDQGTTLISDYPFGAMGVFGYTPVVQTKGSDQFGNPVGLQHTNTSGSTTETFLNSTAGNTQRYFDFNGTQTWREGVGSTGPSWFDIVNGISAFSLNNFLGIDEAIFGYTVVTPELITLRPSGGLNFIDINTNGGNAVQRWEENGSNSISSIISYFGFTSAIGSTPSNWWIWQHDQTNYGLYGNHIQSAGNLPVGIFWGAASNNTFHIGVGFDDNGGGRMNGALTNLVWTAGQPIVADANLTAVTTNVFPVSIISNVPIRMSNNNLSFSNSGQYVQINVTNLTSTNATIQEIDLEFLTGSMTLAGTLTLTAQAGPSVATFNSSHQVSSIAFNGSNTYYLDSSGNFSQPSSSGLTDAPLPDNITLVSNAAAGTWSLKTNRAFIYQPASGMLGLTNSPTTGYAVTTNVYYTNTFNTRITETLRLTNGAIAADTIKLLPFQANGTPIMTREYDWVSATFSTAIAIINLGPGDYFALTNITGQVNVLTNEVQLW